MRSNPLVSVVVPAFNAAGYLAEGLTSILQQTYRPLEVIVVDDGSTDSTAAVAAAYPEVRYFYQLNSGPAAARNFGIKQCRADYVAFHDADDICLPHRLQAQMELFLQEHRLEVVFARIRSFLEPGKIVTPELTRPELLAPRMGFVSSMIVKRSVFDRIGLFNEAYRIGEDLEWLVRVQKAMVCSAVVTDVLIKRRLHDKNLSSDVARGHEALFKILREARTR
ncbi:MAG TPA: glycosyltransferase family A protein [Oligoflexia bacterium]|nr:glycosyltransferase family A protein [Oligoflexia bacterium]